MLFRSEYSSSLDYNLTTTRSLVNNPGLIALRAAGAGGNPIAQAILRSGAFRGNQLCVSAFDPLNAGSLGGRVQTCADNSTEFDYSGGKNKQWSIEGRIASDFDGPFNFLVGGLYLRSTGRDVDYAVLASGFDYMSAFLGVATAFGAGLPTLDYGLAPPFFYSNTDKAALKTYGLFGEVYFDLADNLKITGGLRYSNDKKYIRARQPFLNVLVPYGTTDVNPILANFDADSSKPGQQEFAI